MSLICFFGYFCGSKPIGFFIMRLTIPVELPKRELEISYVAKQMIIGSCFAENIGKRLVACKFPALLNPFGILYNPLSIAEALRRIVDGKLLTEESPELVFYGERWHSMLHHGDFSRRDKADVISTVNDSIENARSFLSGMDLLTLTFGTAYVYRRKSDNMVVGNCHKIPGGEFTRSLLTVDEIVGATAEVFEKVRNLSPDVKLLLTVSPIRHIRDGAHGNQVSKAVLLLAVEELKKCFPGRAFYFPAYEIVLDELRDYRFYAEDMIHPSDATIGYVWDCFKASYFDAATEKLSAQVEEIMRALAHRPFDPDSHAYRDFKSKLLLKIEAVKEKNPFFNFSNEIEQCRIQ